MFEAEDRLTSKKVALKRIEKVGNQLSREYEILHMIKGVPNVVQIEVVIKAGRTSSTQRTSSKS